MNHTIEQIDIAPAALETEPFLAELKSESMFADMLVTSLSSFVREHGKPEPNQYAPMTLYVAQGLLFFVTETPPIRLFCKPRIYQPEPNESIGWAVAIVTDAQHNVLTGLPEDELDGRLVGYLGLEGDEARLWTKRN